MLDFSMPEDAIGVQMLDSERPPADPGEPVPECDAKGGGGSPLEQTLGANEGKGETETTRSKLQKREGSFIEDILLPPREEEWMREEEVSQRKPPMKTYKEAVRPNRKSDDGGEYSFADEEDWDGSLLVSNSEELRRGVTIEDSKRGPLISISEEEQKRMGSKWKNSLIIRLMGGTMGFMQLNRRIQTLWGHSGQVNLSFLGNGYMLATFRSKEDYFHALEGGPWLIQNHYLTVQTWKPNFNLWNEKITKLAIWVRLPGLPVDYYDKKNFFNLGNKIGTTLKVDEMTQLRARTMYARMCVEIDLGAPLLPTYSVDGNLLRIEYEGLHLICFHCGIYGHNQEHCPTKRNQEVAKEMEPGGNVAMQVDEAQPRSNERKGSEKYGEWMLVQDPRKGRKPPPKVNRSGQGQEKTSKGTQRKPSFTVLEVEEPNIGGENDAVSDRRPLYDITNVGENQRRRPRIAILN